MAKITKSSFQLGWIDGLERKVGRSLMHGVDAEAYRRGIERAADFRRRVSAQRGSGLRVEAAGDGGADI
jgi:hypothetical protein